MRQLLIALLVTTATFATFVGAAMSQENLPFGPENYEQDYQMFAPFSLDLNNMTDKQVSSYFFNYDKLFWSYSGERVTVGSGNVSETISFLNSTDSQAQQITATNGEFAEIIYRVNTVANVQNADGMTTTTLSDQGTLPAPYVVHNTLNNVPPKAGFALGNRYELGYHDQGHGWKIGVLDGPELNQTETYGLPQNATGGYLQPVNQDYSGASASPGDRAFGFGSVPVLFETPPGFLEGFRDYMNNFADALLGTQRGIIAYVGNYGSSTDSTDLPVPFLHEADDINGNGIQGAIPVTVVLPDGTTQTGFIHDYGDLFKYDVFFDSVTVHNRTVTNGVELMWTHDLSTQDLMAKHQNNQFTIGYGVRYFKLYDEFNVNAFGSILGDSNWDTSFTNNIVGPQVSFQWVNERQRWRIQTDARFMAGYNIANWNQTGLIGQDLIPGAINSLLYGRPTAFSHGLRDNEFAPVGELRVSASYHITNAFAINFGYTGAVVGGIKRAASSVRYYLPDMGYEDAGTQTLLVNGFDLGVQFVH